MLSTATSLIAVIWTVMVALGLLFAYLSGFVKNPEIALLALIVFGALPAVAVRAVGLLFSALALTIPSRRMAR